MTAKIRILFVNDEMKMGGVARVLNNLMQALPRDRYDIDLMVLHKEGMLLKEIPDDVRVFEGSAFFHPVDETLLDLLHSHRWGEVLRKLRLLFYMKTGLIRGRIRKERAARHLEHYDVEVAAKEGFCTIFTACGDSRKKINWVLTDYSVRNYSKNHMHLVRQALKHIDLNIADSEQALIAYETVFRVSNGMTIHNLMDDRKVRQARDLPLEQPLEPGLTIINIARFHPQKGLERLILASQAALEAGCPHTLYLVGGGEEEQKLRDLVQSLHMTNVRFLGYLANPYTLLAHCDLFVLSSYYEGFATIVNESLIAHTPVLMTSVGGCREQLTRPEHGWIVANNQEALNQGLVKALKDPDRLHEMKQQLQNYEYPNQEILERFMEILQ